MPTIRLTNIRVVVFDLDDTLVSERDYAWSGFAAVAKWLAEQLPGQLPRKNPCSCLSDSPPFDPVARMQQLFDSPYRSRVFNQLLAEMGQPEEAIARLVPAMIERFRDHVPIISLLPDAERALNRWQGRYFALISDGPQLMQRRKVDALHLSDRLNLIVLTDEWGRDYWKPHPRAFKFVEIRSCHQGSACVYIADNPAKDFVAPRQLGWRTVQVRREESIYVDTPPAAGGDAEFQVGTLDEIDMG